MPTWFDDAKFGIFIHWGLYSVPAFAPVEEDIVAVQKKGLGYYFKYTPYAEWYQNSLRIDGSPVQEYHARTFGTRPYESFADDFNSLLPKWRPGDWADLFQQAGAKYMVLVTKHHDGFVMWPTEHPNPLKPDYHATRDIPGELAREVRARGIRFCTYYSGTLDWSFQPEPIVDFASMVTNGPTSRQYVDYANAHWRELIDKHGPSILWNDIGYPPGTDVNEIFLYYYQKHPDGLVNDRWVQVSSRARKALKTRLVKWLANGIAAAAIRGGKTEPNFGYHHDFTTPEYKTYPVIKKKKWECTRGIGHSFGYNHVEGEHQYLSTEALVHMLIDIVSKNGNLLLNIGPKADGTIQEIQRNRVLAIGKWLATNGEAIYGTRPWTRPSASTSEKIGVRFTRKGDDLFAILLGTPTRPRVEILSLRIPAGSKLQLLGREGDLEWKHDGPNAVLSVPDCPAGAHAHAIKIAGGIAAP
ncbi:MAG: alpha-L-fucosidase [Candidatus Lokiarchaeota archaeon]|nr:alpha-L-fucosidase [Candidatus Lokiarchaeota archaeon]